MRRVSTAESQPSAVLDLTLSLDTNIYADADVLAATQEVPLAFSAPGGTLTLRNVVVLDEDDQGIAFDILFLNAASSIGTENAAVSVTDALARTIIGRVSVAGGDYYDLVANRLAVVSNINQVLRAAEGSTSLYVACVSRGAGTYSASGIKLKFGVTY